MGAQGSEQHSGSPGQPVDAARTLLGAKLATVIVSECLPLVGADAGFVATLGADGETLEVERVTPFSERAAHLSFPADAPYPIAHTIRTREPLLVASNDELCEHPGLVRVKSEDHACATMPLFAQDGTLLGALNFGFDEPHAFAEEEVEVIGVVARRCAEAMSVAWGLERELDGRAGAEAD
jgi:GAF domain-containing protein